MAEANSKQLNSTVIAGSIRGKKLVNPEKITRPLTNRIKQSLFDLIRDFIDGAEVLDLYAGGGNFGIEALSRGAESATFVDIALQSQKAVEKNLEDHPEFEYEFHKQNVQDYIRLTDREFDLIMLDPPFDDVRITYIKDAAKLLKSNGLLIFRHPEQYESPENLHHLKRTHEERYGKSTLSFYQNT
ncbi:16S rRNA (guanine(966)-N(2))-methyltransferase RsmD [Candidatus Dojkabacteria bacterium]|nr:16S rRNA (guanine(966)-N(2))-methyltransferase RsmD [Candidatus Dojkabacteria bacterium]